MSSPGEGPEDAIAFGQRLLSLLDTGSFTTTSKYATLLAIIDQALARVGSEGQPPRRLPVAVLGERVLELYWQQARPFGESGPLRQGMRGDVPSRIAALRRDLGLPSGARLEVTRKHHPDQIAALQQEITDTVGRYPVPLLQRFGPGRTAEEDRFVYDYDWAPGSIPGPDAGIVFVEDAAEHLMTLAGLLRPLVHREWARFVASRNQLEQDSIEEFLFGARRRSLQSLRAPLRDLYTGRCFYCEGELRSSFEIDHFLPWAKFPDDRLDNLVPAHRGCNNDKRDALASIDHLERWWVRFDPAGATFSELEGLAGRIQWPRDPLVTGRAARGLYLHQGRVGRLWAGKGRTSVADPGRLRDLLVPSSRDVLDLAAEQRGGYPRPSE